MHNIPDYLIITPEMQEHFANGGMIKRADGSYSRRGLWDNIRANRGSGKKPTREMLEQEAKIRAQEQYGGIVEEYGRGGYTVKRSNARKGKTHVVIGPDGTKKYFGDSKLGQHPGDPERKKAFYARHKRNLENNPYFRAFARATWEDGGEVPEFGSGGSYGPFYNRRDAAKMQRWRTPNANSMTPHFDVGGLNVYQNDNQVVLNPQQPGVYNLGQQGPVETEPQTANSGQGINTTSPAWSSSISPISTTPNITTAGLDKQNQNQFTMDEKQITTKSPSDDTKIQEGNKETDDIKINPSSIKNFLSKFNSSAMIGKSLGQLSDSMSSALSATSILSRGFGNSEQNALLDFNRKQDNPTNYLNKVSNFAGIQYAKDGVTIGQYKEGDEIELTPTQMYLLEKKGYKFQII